MLQPSRSFRSEDFSCQRQSNEMLYASFNWLNIKRCKRCIVISMQAIEFMLACMTILKMIRQDSEKIFKHDREKCLIRRSEKNLENNLPSFFLLRQEDKKFSRVVSENGGENDEISVVKFFSNWVHLPEAALLVASRLSLNHRAK